MPRPGDRSAPNDWNETREALSYPASSADLLDQLGVAVVVMDPGRVITHWNAEAERVFGWSVDEAIGHRGVDVGLSAGGLLQSVGLAVQVLGGEPVEGDLPVRTKDGRPLLAHFWARPVLASDGAVAGLIAAATVPKLDPAIADLAEKVAAERLADRLHRLEQISARLARADCIDDVADAVVSETTACLGAQAAMVMSLRGDRFDALATTGIRADVLGRYRTFAVYEALPAADVLRRRQPLLWASLADRDRDYPQYAGMPYPQKRWALFPLVAADRAIGTLVLGWAEPAPFDEVDVLFLRVVAGQCAQALDRARVDRAEEATRAEQDPPARGISPTDGSAVRSRVRPDQGALPPCSARRRGGGRRRAPGESGMAEPPTILFACTHNAGRSVAAKVLAEHYANGRVIVRSAGSEPGDSVNPMVTAVLAERGLTTEQETPKLLDRDAVEAADVVVTMGCDESCPVFPGKHYEDWPVDDPAGQDLDTVRRIVDDVDSRVRRLLSTSAIRA